MRAAAIEAFIELTKRLEGVTNYMYLDVLGLVTTGVGNLIDPPAAATALPWRRRDNSLATRGEILDEWERTRRRQDLRKAGGGAFAKLATLHLDDDGIQQLLHDRIRTNDASLRKRFRGFEEWPSDAQMAIHSLAWACGSAFRFPKMEAALNAGDFRTAADEIKMTPESNPGNNLKARNLANRVMMLNAAAVVDFKLDPEAVYYPDSVDAPVAAEAVTEPELPDLAPDSEPEELTIHLLPVGRRSGADRPTEIVGPNTMKDEPDEG